ncbi:MAG: oxaloacetate-decarboxylating malate dehydrogenase, partial [Desulfobulbaceae bacterium]|nr:oxaloacetate-decarboxylating malate dehydrogenase [Desulfobulbaceae bacterium]
MRAPTGLPPERRGENRAAAEPFKFVYDIFGNTEVLEVKSRGLEILNNNYLNKGTAFTMAERQQFELSGMLPPATRTLAHQVRNSRGIFQKKESDLEKFIYVRSLFDRNAVLAHALIASDLENLMRIIYTPTVGLACQEYSSMFRKANGIHFFPGNIDQATEILRQYRNKDIRVAVVTDNQGILGIGDQGAGGIAICLGKLMLYTQGAGIAPWHCLPISLDVGTDNQKLIADDDYLGWRHPRLKGDEYIRFIQKFARAFQTVFPNALCQWEDFSKQNAFAIRDSYLHQLLSFNDDIQGTGAIALAAIIAAMKIKKANLSEQVFLIHGAGAGGVGIAEQIYAALLAAGLPEAAAADRIFTMDSQGLVTSNRALDPYKEKFAKDPARLPWLQDPQDGTLEMVIANAGVTVLIGTSGQHGCFSQPVVAAILRNTARPVILPLSNPNALAEALPEEICRWTGGNGLIATGSPFPPLTTPQGEIRVGQ